MSYPAGAEGLVSMYIQITMVFIYPICSYANYIQPLYLYIKHCICTWHSVKKFNYNGTEPWKGYSYPNTFFILDFVGFITTIWKFCFLFFFSNEENISSNKLDVCITFEKHCISILKKYFDFFLIVLFLLKRKNY